jgi:hypothetical protein
MGFFYKDLSTLALCLQGAPERWQARSRGRPKKKIKKERKTVRQVCKHPCNGASQLSHTSNRLIHDVDTNIDGTQMKTGLFVSGTRFVASDSKARAYSEPAPQSLT